MEAEPLIEKPKLKLKLKAEDDALTRVRGLSLFDKFYKLPSLQGFTGEIYLNAKGWEYFLENSKVL